MLGKLSIEGNGGRSAQNNEATVSQEFIRATLRWLVNRQTSHLYEEEEEDEYPATEHVVPSLPPNEQLPLIPIHEQPPPLIHALDAPREPLPPIETLSPRGESLHISQQELQWAGLNGRTNKIADTCYSFWAGGTLDVSLILTLFTPFRMLIASLVPDPPESPSPGLRRQSPLPTRQDATHRRWVRKAAW